MLALTMFCWLFFLGAAQPQAGDLQIITMQKIGNLGEPGRLPRGFEPSGAVWHEGRQSLITVSDEGWVAELDDQGIVLGLWPLRGDLEAVTITDPSSPLVYVGIEHPDGIVEFDLDKGKRTGQQWDLRPWLQGPDKRGLEALTFAGELFFAGLQHDGQIFTFRLFPDGVVEFKGKLQNPNARVDISGLQHDSCTNQLFAIYDSLDQLVTMDLAGQPLAIYSLPGDGQEGLAMSKCDTMGNYRMFLSLDGGEILSLSVVLPANPR